MYVGPTHPKWYLVQVDMDQSQPVSVTKYGVYRWRWYVRQYDNCNKYTTMECHFWPEIRKKNQDGMLGKIFPARPIKVHKLLENIHIHVWYQYYIYLDEHSLVGPFQFGTTGRRNLKWPNMIKNKQWKECYKEVQKKGINTSDTKEAVQFGRW